MNEKDNKKIYLVVVYNFDYRYGDDVVIKGVFLDKSLAEKLKEKLKSEGKYDKIELYSAELNDKCEIALESSAYYGI